MRDSTDLFIPIPRTRNTHCKVEINGVDQTSRIVNSKFIYPATKGIGTFSLIVTNAHGQFTGDYSAGNIVKFYADNEDSTTLQFQGIIDFVKEDISEAGQFLEIEGRHRSYLLTEQLMCYSVVNKSPGEILKDLVDKLPVAYGFTYTNVDADDSLMSVEWEYKPFWECIFELCKYANFDCYVDNDLDFHYFEANSTTNKLEAIVEGDNFLKTIGWGTDNTYQKTRITAMGQDSSGIPIIYTAVSSTEGDEIRESFLKDSSSNTEDKVKNLAELKLSQLSNDVPQAKIKSYGLETITPGENIWILIPRQKIMGQYKILEFTHSFGIKNGGWRTECLIEKEEVGVSSLIQGVDQQVKAERNPNNINKMNYSWNLDFSIDSGEHNSTEFVDGALKTDGSATGTWVSDLFESSSKITAIEPRIKGNSLSETQIFLSVDGGNSYSEIAGPRTTSKTIKSGKKLKLKVILNSATTEIDGLGLLYNL